MKTAKKRFALVLWAALNVYGCVSMSDQAVIIGGSGAEEGIHKNCFDQAGTFQAGEVFPKHPDTVLNSMGFSLLNWNSYKGSGENWEKDFERFVGDIDIFTLQEGYLTDSLKTLLKKKEYTWNIASAFTYYDVHTGVLTASRVQPQSLCSFQAMEPISGIPKTVLVTSYPLSGTDKALLLANLHMVNFTLDSDVYRAQLTAVAQILLQHDGPFILAGDFNSWSRGRMKILEEIAGQLSAKPVYFAEDMRTSFMGKIVDHIYYRGLEQVDSLTEMVTTSDHNPMMVTFRLNEVR